MVITFLPVGADPPGDPAEKVAGQMRHLDPRQNQVPRVVGDLVKIVPVGGLGRADEAVAQVELQGRRTPRQTGHRAIARHNQILQVLADRPAVAKIVVVAQQLGKEGFVLGAPHQLDRQRPQRGHGTRDRRGVVRRASGHSAVRDGVVGRRPPFGRQFDLSSPMQRQHQAAADHVAGLAVGLHPPPRRTHLDRELPPAQRGMLRDEFAQEHDVGFADLPTAVAQQYIRHAAEPEQKSYGTLPFSEKTFRPVRLGSLVATAARCRPSPDRRSTTTGATDADRAGHCPRRPLAASAESDPARGAFGRARNLDRRRSKT